MRVAGEILLGTIWILVKLQRPPPKHVSSVRVFLRVEEQNRAAPLPCLYCRHEARGPAPITMISFSWNPDQQNIPCVFCGIQIDCFSCCISFTSEAQRTRRRKTPSGKTAGNFNARHIFYYMRLFKALLPALSISFSPDYS